MQARVLFALLVYVDSLLVPACLLSGERSGECRFRLGVVPWSLLSGSEAVWRVNRALSWQLAAVGSTLHSATNQKVRHVPSLLCLCFLIYCVVAVSIPPYKALSSQSRKSFSQLDPALLMLAGFS